MALTHWLHILAAALVGAIFHFVWAHYLKKVDVKNFKSCFIFLILSFFQAWGLDILQADFEVHRLFDMFRLCTGAWMCLTASATFKVYVNKRWNKKEFIIEQGSEYIGICLIGLMVYVLT
jgi:hypothetical protein